MDPVVAPFAQEAFANDPKGDSRMACFCFPCYSPECGAIILELMNHDALDVPKTHT